MQPNPAPPPWYKQFWPWFIIAVPASAVVMGIIMITLATRSPVSMVVDDYYKEGLAINQQLEKQSAAATMGIQALVRFDNETDHMTLAINDNNGSFDGVVRLNLVHPTLANQDRSMLLAAEDDGQFHVDLTDIRPGHWHISLGPVNEAWRVTGRISLTDKAQVFLSHGE